MMMTRIQRRHNRPHRLSAETGWRECTARAKCNLRLPWLLCNYCLLLCLVILFYWFLFRELLNLLSSGNWAAVRVGGAFRHKSCGLCGVNYAGRSNFRCYYLPNANGGLQSCCMWLQYK